MISQATGAPHAASAPRDEYNMSEAEQETFTRTRWSSIRPQRDGRSSTLTSPRSGRLRQGSVRTGDNSGQDTEDYVQASPATENNTNAMYPLTVACAPLSSALAAVELFNDPRQSSTYCGVNQLTKRSLLKAHWTTSKQVAHSS